MKKKKNNEMKWVNCKLHQILIPKFKWIKCTASGTRLQKGSGQRSLNEWKLWKSSEWWVNKMNFGSHPEVDIKLIKASELLRGTWAPSRSSSSSRDRKKNYNLKVKGIDYLEKVHSTTKKKKSSKLIKHIFISIRVFKIIVSNPLISYF